MATSSDTVPELVQRCRDRGLRRTDSLEMVLQLLLDAERPLTASEIVEAPELKGHCDPATVYRLLVRLEEHGILRRLGLRDRIQAALFAHEHKLA